MKKLLLFFAVAGSLSAQVVRGHTYSVIPSPAGTPGGASAGQINFFDSTGGYSIALAAPSLSGNAALTLPVPTGTAGCWLDNGSGVTTIGSCGAGSGISSITLTVPAGFNVTGSPLTGSGTLAISFTSETANTFLGSPSGSSGAPSFRALVAADIPTTLNATTFPSATVTGALSAGSISAGTISTSTLAFNNLSVGQSAIGAVFLDIYSQVGSGSAFAKLIRFRNQSAPFDRWDMGTDGVTETGSNAGSNFTLTGFADDGSTVLESLTIYRNTGLLNYIGTIAASGLSTSALTVSGSGPVQFNANTIAGTHAQNVGTSDSPTFSSATSGAFTLSSGATIGQNFVGGQYETRITGTTSRALVVIANSGTGIDLGVSNLSVSGSCTGCTSGVTSVSGTSPIVSSGGATPAISCSTCVTNTYAGALNQGLTTSSWPSSTFSLGGASVIPSNYGSGIAIPMSASFVNSGSIPGTYSKGIPVYNSAGTYQGMIPVI